MVRIINTYIHITRDAFNEGDHPRDTDGKFGSGPVAPKGSQVLSAKVEKNAAHYTVKEGTSPETTHTVALKSDGNFKSHTIANNGSSYGTTRKGSYSYPDVHRAIEAHYKQHGALLKEAVKPMETKKPALLANVKSNSREAAKVRRGFS